MFSEQEHDEFIQRSSFVVQPYRRKYLQEYCKRMSTDNTNCLFDDNVASVLVEQGFSIKESPRSVYRVEKLYDSLAKYEPKIAPRVDMNSSDSIQFGVNLAYACFAKPKDQDYLELQEFSPKLVYDITSNHQGSAGLTAWGQTKAESYVRAYERGLQQIIGQKKPEPCVAFKRTQFNDKTRLVWGYPYAMTALEGIFARPLIERFKLGNTPMAFGMSTGALGGKLRVSSYHKRFAYSTDYSSFDSTVSSEVIRTAFRILKTWFDLDRIEPTSGVEYRKIWNMIVDYFISTPIVMPDSNIYYGKRGGVPSGSYFTQMVDSIANVIMVGAISNEFSLDVSKDDIFVLGDDILYYSNRYVPLDHIANYVAKVFSVKLNVDKSSLHLWNEPVHFLGRVWTNGVPSADVDDILIRMTQPENFRKYSKDQVQKAREVRMLILSYATVYREAYPIYLKAMGVVPRFATSNMSIENYAYGSYTKDDVNPNFMSGLERYMRKYVRVRWGSNAVNPLALQFWR